MRIAAVVLILFAGSIHAALAATVPPDFPAEMARLLAAEKVPSVSIARIEHGKLVYAATFGEQSAGVPATPLTLYNIASLTKPISAETILRLATLGKIDLDEPMSAYWVDPDLANDPRAGKLTPRLALSHRTGFPNWRRKKPLAFIREPGEWGYSGEGYQYVARFAERKTGSSLDSLAESLIFQPAGMLSTAYTRQPWFEGRVAVPTDEKGQALEPEFTEHAIAADLIYTTASDYARFMIEVAKDAHLSPSIALQRRTVQTDLRNKWCKDPASPDCPDHNGMGLGWAVASFGRHVYLTHDGSDDGVKTFAYVSPTSGEGVVILTNGANGTKLVVPILRKLGASKDFLGYLEHQAT